jgi:hypothetical protein
MLKAVLRKGVIVPLEPLPAEWEEGVALEVARAAAAAGHRRLGGVHKLAVRRQSH